MAEDTGNGASVTTPSIEPTSTHPRHRPVQQTPRDGAAPGSVHPLDVYRPTTRYEPAELTQQVAHACAVPAPLPDPQFLPRFPPPFSTPDAGVETVDQAAAPARAGTCTRSDVIPSPSWFG